MKQLKPIDMNSNRIIYVAAPQDSTDAATKGYVDTAIAGFEVIPSAIKEQNEQLTTHFWIGTKAEYDAIATKDPNTQYTVTDEYIDDTMTVTAADKLSAAKTIALTGDVTGSVSTDFSSNASIVTTVADNSHNHTAANISDFDTEVSNNTNVAANTSARHSHSNKTVLDNTTASYTTAEQTKLSGIATGATANTGTVTSVVAGTGLSGGTISTSGTIAVNYGTTATTACVGNDSRLSDARTPVAHTHTVLQITDYVAPSLTGLGVTATAAELNALDGITASVTELNYCDGVTSNIQAQLGTKAPLASPTFTGTVTAPTFSGALTGNASTATSATTATGIQGSDTRYDNKAPSSYIGLGADMYLAPTYSRSEFKSISTMGLGSYLTGSYCYVMTHVPWSNISGGVPVQFAYGNGVPCYRIAASDTAWGTWTPINNGGAAETATNATNATTATTALNIPTSDVGGNIWIA